MGKNGLNLTLGNVDYTESSEECVGVKRMGGHDLEMTTEGWNGELKLYRKWIY